MSKTELKILNYLNSNHVYCSVVEHKMTSKGRREYGYRNRNACLKLVSKGLAKIIPNQDRGVMAIELIN